MTTRAAESEPAMSETPRDKVTAVVVAYRSASTIRACVDSLLRDPVVAHVIVIDNSADAESEALVKEMGPRTTYRAARNDGFAAGCNRGLALVRTRFVAFVNPDLEMTGPLSDVLTILDANPRSLASGESSVTSHSSARRTVTPRRELAKCVLGSRAYDLPRPEGRQPVQVEQLSGALIIATTAFMRELGGFDERFELYYEDVDLCARARAIGSCWLLPTPVARHAGGKSFEQSGGTAFIASRVSRVRYLRKHFPRLAAPTALAITAVETTVRTLALRPEGLATRRRAMSATIHETLRPGSVRVLRRGADPR